jgi:Glycosyl hydrolase family 99/Calcineurin-like phosphoesterase
MMTSNDLRVSRPRALRIVLALTLLGLAAGASMGRSPVGAAPVTTTVVATADTYVDSSAPTVNFGSRSTVYADGQPERAVLVKFAVPPGIGDVTRATLRLYVAGSSPAGVGARASTSDWEESTVTWDSAPPPGAELGAVPGVTGDSWADVDVTAGVRAGDDVTLWVDTSGPRRVSILARESGEAFAPQLVIQTEPSSPSPESSPTVSASPTAAGGAQPTFPIRAAFYYPWFPEAWSQSGVNPFTWYHPSRGYYDGTSAPVVSAQISDMLYAGMDAGIASWWGQGSKEDRRIPLLLNAAAGTAFRWSLYYEPESLGDPSVAQIRDDLTHLMSSFGSHPSFLRIDGKPVLFVYADSNDGCGMARRWADANTVGAYIVLKVFPGYAQCPDQPAGWHQYGPAVATSNHSPYSFAVSPGFLYRMDSSPVLTRDPARFDSNVAAMVASKARFQLVTTFNEWGEGTAVESATQWASPSGRGTYLDILRKHLVGSQAPSPNSTATPSPTATATGIATATATASPTATAAPTATASPTATATSSPTATATASSGSDVVIAAAGDISCDPGDGNFKGGAGTSSACRMKETSDLMLGMSGLDAVLPLGDVQYEDGTLDKFYASYEQSWGRPALKSISKPVPGNHEYGTSGAAGYFSYFGALAGDPTKGYYSYDLGSWHVVALNSNCSPVGGCGASSDQVKWLKADLAAHPAKCTMAYWHHPRFSSGEHGNHSWASPMWDALYDAGAEVVLSGHDHHYERFAPQTSSGVADASGIRQFVVGTGGKNHYGITTLQPNSQVHDTDTYGVLKVTLHDNSYDWQFVPERGKTFTDSGTAPCH